MVKQFTLEFFGFIILLLLLLVLLQDHSFNSTDLLKILLHIEFPQIIDNSVVLEPIDHIDQNFFVDFGLLKEKFHLPEVSLK